ncbi:hypothetical protein [Roseivirga sp. E12]|uniref:hypothetical protein n=1 Tax=Roseivirga sp. E12 TaxID=2819237 RepID=UPI001ABC15E6|nr:hypothetical protein [Roseivirga sp. E12]MBO3698568.1 hypothetical protein [Roseivirga sp. E12]
MSKLKLENHINELIIICISIKMGIVPIERVTTFSDETLLKEEDPHPIFIDLSLYSSDKNAILEILGTVILDNHHLIDESILINIIGEQYEKGAFSLENSVMALNKLSLEYDLDEKISSMISSLDDQYHLISNEYVLETMIDFERELKAFFREHHLSQKMIILD